MKLRYLFIFLIVFGSCARKGKPTTMLSLQNKWGVICYFAPAAFTDQQRAFFLPFANAADSSTIKKQSSIFDYNYSEGLEFKDHGRGTINYKTYWSAWQKRYLSVNYDTAQRVYWTFAKIRFHVIGSQKNRLSPQTIKLTLLDKKNQLPIEVDNVNWNIIIDTAFFKPEFVWPKIDTQKFKLRKSGKLLPR